MEKDGGLYRSGRGSGSTAAEEAPVAEAEKISKALVATGARLQRENCAETKRSRDICVMCQGTYVCPLWGTEAAESLELNYNWLQSNCGGGMRTGNQT